MAFWGDNRSSFSDKANCLLEDIQIEREEVGSNKASPMHDLDYSIA
jgi:hypothetical protein